MISTETISIDHTMWKTMCECAQHFLHVAIFPELIDKFFIRPSCESILKAVSEKVVALHILKVVQATVKSCTAIAVKWNMEM